jgi:hypothetical protein
LGYFKPEILQSFERLLKKSYFSFIELIFMDIAGKLSEKPGITPDNIEDLILSLGSWLMVLKNTSFKLVVCNKKMVTFFLLAKEDSMVIMDGQTREVSSYDLDEISKELNLLLNKD